ALLGANGAGKTTTLRAICAMVQTRGEIRFGGERIDGRSTEDIARLGIAHVLDGRGTFLNLTTEENLRLGACTRRDRAAVAADRAYLIETGRVALAGAAHELKRDDGVRRAYLGY